MTLHTLYRFYNGDGQLLYIGITCNPGARLDKHRDTKTWWSEIARITMEQHASREELRQAERDAILAEDPRYNIRGRTGQKLSTPDHAQAQILDVLDGLMGRWFHSWRPADEDDIYQKTYNGRRPQWQGQVVDRDGHDSYFVQLYSWWDGCANGGEQLIARTEMSDWTFYRSSEEMQMALGCSEYFMSSQRGRRRGPCHNPATHRTSAGNYVCWDCAQFYSSAEALA